jgi:hypothetical protein
MRLAHEAAVADLRAEHLRARSEAEEAFRVEREGLTTQHQQALAAERTRAEQAVDRGRAETQALQQKLQDDAATVEKRHAEELGFLHARQGELEGRLAEMSTQAAAAMAHAKAVDESLRASDEERAAALGQHRLETEARHAEDLAVRDRRHAELEAELEGRLRAARTEARRGEEALRREHEAALAAVVATAREEAKRDRLEATGALASADAAIASLRAERVQLESSHEEQKAAFQSEVARVTGEASAGLARAQAEQTRVLEEARHAHAQEVMRLRGTWDEAMEKLQRDLVQSRAIGAHRSAALNELQDRFERTQRKWQEEATTATGARVADERSALEKAHEAALGIARAELDALGRKLTGMESGLAQERQTREHDRAAHEAAVARLREEHEREAAEVTARMTHRAETATKMREEVDAARRREAGASAAAGALRGALQEARQQLEQAHGEARAQLEAVADALRAELAEATRSVRAELETRLAEAHGRAAGSERLVKEARADAEARAKDLEVGLQGARDAQSRALEAAKAAAAVELAGQLEAAAVSREKAVVEARAAARAEAERERSQALAELSTDLRAAADEKREAALAEVRTDLERAAEAERSRLETRIRELGSEIAQRDTEREQRERAAGQGLTLRLAALEALVASRTEDVERVFLDLEEARAEVPALEAEIVVLRSELMSVRRQLDQQVTASIASEAQLERDRTLLSRAAETILELKANFGRRVD